MRKFIRAHTRTIVAGISLLSILPIAAIAVAQTALKQPKKFPIAISKPGSYQLTENLEVKSGDAIRVSSSNVSIDLDGFTISGSAGGSSQDGINAIGMSFVRVFNGSVTNMGGSGIALGASSSVESVRVSGNGANGISCGNNCSVADSNVSSNALSGISAAGNSSIRDSIANGNTNGFGIAVGPGSSVTGNTATGNAIGGISAGNHVVPCNCRIVGNVASGNSIGIFVGDSAVISGNMTGGNQGFGICGGKSSTIQGNT